MLIRCLCFWLGSVDDGCIYGYCVWRRLMNKRERERGVFIPRWMVFVGSVDGGDGRGVCHVLVACWNTCMLLFLLDI